MGCCNSRLESEETVSRCKARLRYMKQLVKAGHSFLASHSLYLRALRSTGSALLQFANAETHLHHKHQHHQQQQRHHLPPPPPRPPTPLTPQPPPMSPNSDTWTSTASPVPPPPPPPPPSSWDFWDPFLPSSSRSVTEEEWEEAATTVSDVTAAAPAAPPSPAVPTDLAVVVSRSKKDLSEIVKELDEYFLKAAEAGSGVSAILESKSSGLSYDHGLTGKVCGYSRSLSPVLWPWGSNSNSSGFSGFSRFSGEVVVGGGGEMRLHEVVGPSHCSTLDKLCAWEKKLYTEVKDAEKIKEEHGKKVGLLRRMEVKGGGDYLKVERNKKEIEKLESKLMVATQAILTTSAEISRLRESELFPQLLELVNGMRIMWRGMYECHQVQTHIVQHLQHLSTINTGSSPTSELHQQSTAQLELEVQQWHSSFCSLVESQRDYIHSLTGWLRLSLFQFHHSYPLTKAQESSNLYSFCDEWQLALDRVPDKVASEGIKSFLTVIHAIVLQQAEEFKLKKRSESAFKELEKRTAELRSLECKHGYDPTSDRSPVFDKRAKVDALKVKAEDEKNKYDKCAGVTRAMTLNSLQTGFPNIFQAITGFSNVCAQALEAVYNRSECSDRIHDPKRLLA